mgnify:CR=1 FL=1
MSTNVLAGPAEVHIDDSAIGETEGGITCTFTPEVHEINIDRYGAGVCAIRHSGETAAFTVPWDEWTAATMAKIYTSGNDQTAAMTAPYIGIGRTAGFIYTGKDVKIKPILTAEVAKFAQIYKGVPLGELSIGFANDNNRVFEREFRAILDTAKTDGEMLGKVAVAA